MKKICIAAMMCLPAAGSAYAGEAVKKKERFRGEDHSPGEMVRPSAETVWTAIVPGIHAG